MKVKTYIFLFVLCFTLQFFSQTKLDDIPGIPVIGDFNFDSVEPIGSFLERMQRMGINVLHGRVESSSVLDYLADEQHPFEGIIVNNTGQNFINDYIIKYTSSIYSVWDAADTLYFKHFLMSEITENDTAILVLNDHDVPNGADSLIKGPYYRQIQNNNQISIHFILKIITNPNYNGTFSPNDPICELKVSYGNLMIPNTEWKLDESDIISKSDPIITRSSFEGLGIWSDLKFTYDIPANACVSINGSNAALSIPKALEYVNFKIKWEGSTSQNIPKYILSIKNIIVSDQVGNDLKIGADSSKVDISNQINIIGPDFRKILGWWCFDEPNSIDNFEPIRIVQNILESNFQQKLWIQMMGHPYGCWNQKENPWGTYHLSPWDEMEKRIVTVNGWQDFYYWDYPYKPGDEHHPLYKDDNISCAIENYKKARNLTSNFGVSLQCGAQFDLGIAEQRTPTNEELWYSANLALLYGAKFFTLYEYIAQVDSTMIDNPLPWQALVNLGNGIPNPSARYYLFKYHITPTLQGLFGQTLKKLTAESQGNVINHGALPMSVTLENPNNPGFLKGISFLPPGQQSLPKNYHVDYGNFIDNLDPTRKFLMVVNRPYETKSIHYITLQNLTGSNNWKIKKYTPGEDEFTVNPVNGEITFCDTIDLGEAELYSIDEVVKYGGDLTVNETILGSVTLKSNPLVIKSGAKLTITGTYYINQKIVVEEGGELCIAPGGIIQFNSADSLFIYGKLTAIGTGANRPVIRSYSNLFRFGTISFIGNSSSTSVLKNAELHNSTAIMLLNGANITIDSCSLDKFYNGVYLYNSSPVITNNTISDPVLHGIFGEANGLNPLIRKNIINKAPSTWTGSGVWLYNGTIPLFLENNIEYFYYGAIFTSSTTFFWQTQAPNPNNCIHDNIYGLYANGSSVFAGYANGTGGNNSIHSNTIQDGMSTNSSILNAAKNYWASQTPRAWKDNTSQMDVSLPLTAEVCGNTFRESDIQPGSADLLQGMTLENQGQIDGAITFYKDLISNEEAPAFAINNLERIRQKYSRNELHGYFKQLLARNNIKHLVYNVLANIAIKKGAIDSAITLYEYLENNYQGFISNQAKLRKLYTMLYEKKNMVLANNVLNELKNLNFTDDYMKMEIVSAEALLTGHTGMLNKSSFSSNLSELENCNLYANYPNPFNPSTNIKFFIPNTSWVTLKIYDVLGREVQTLVDENKDSGLYNVIFDGKDLSSGLYIYQLRFGNFISSKKMLLIK